MGKIVKISLDEYKAIVVKDVEQFATQWRKGMSENPKNWPSKMGEADWLEQLISFLNSKESGNVF